MVFAYSGMHFAIFVVVGMAAAFMVSEFEANPPVGVVLLLLFICFEAGFFGVTVGIAPGVIGVLGAWLVGIANLLAAGAMAAYLLWWSHPNAFRSLDKVWEK
jgi:pheromone shutdown protein TraB